jgi:hypothetical protein
MKIRAGVLQFAGKSRRKVDAMTSGVKEFADSLKLPGHETPADASPPTAEEQAERAKVESRIANAGLSEGERDFARNLQMPK